MSTRSTTESIAEAPRLNARIAGVLWLTCIVTGIVGFVITSPMIVAGDAAATAANVTAKESLFRFGALANLMSGGVYLGVTGILYYLLKPVSRSVSIVAALFGLAGVAVGAIGSFAQFVPFLLLRQNPALAAFTTNQLQALAMISLSFPVLLFNIGMTFFGVQCVLVGSLIARSTFLPRAIGVLLAVGGLCYVISSFANLLAPHVGAHFTPFIMPIALLGEGTLTVWLLVRGVDEQRWITLHG